MLRVAIGSVASSVPTVKLGPISTSILSHTQIIYMPSFVLQDLPIPINLTTRAFGKKKNSTYKAQEKMKNYSGWQTGMIALLDNLTTY